MYFKSTAIANLLRNTITTLVLFTFTMHVSFGQGVQIDNSFGEDGFFKFSFQDTYVRGEAAMIQKDNKIIIAGYNNTDRQVLLVRTTENGLLDSVYGENGVATISGNNNLIIEDMNVATICEDESIIVGLSCYPVSDYYPVEATLIKLNKLGQIDSSFGDNGFAIQFVSEMNFTATINDILIQSDNKILFCGHYFDIGSDDINHFFVGRCLPDGSPDPSFGKNGIVTEAFDGSPCAAQTIYRQHDGKILVGGKLNNDFAIARYDQAGKLDETFANGGKLVTNVANAMALNAIAELKDHTIILAGFGLYYGYQDCSPYYRSILIGLSQDGVLSGNFSETGNIQYLTGNCVSVANDILIQSDNKILVGGSGGKATGNGLYNLTISRLTENGLLDESIGGEGDQDFISGLDKNYCVALSQQSDGKLIMAGYGYDDSHYYLIAMRADAGLIPPGHTLVEHEHAEIWSYDKTIYLTNKAAEDVKCNLVNALGQIIFTFTTPPGESTYNLPELPDGWYVLSLNMPYGLVTHKLLFTN